MHIERARSSTPVAAQTSCSGRKGRGLVAVSGVQPTALSFPYVDMFKLRWSDISQKSGYLLSEIETHSLRSRSYASHSKTFAMTGFQSLS